MDHYDFSSLISIQDLVDECNIREQHVLECDYMSPKMKLGYMVALKDIVSYCHFLEIVSEKEMNDLENGDESNPVPSSNVDDILKILRKDRKS